MDTITQSVFSSGYNLYKSTVVTINSLMEAILSND
jgi:hypothetical protein